MFCRVVNESFDPLPATTRQPGASQSHAIQVSDQDVTDTAAHYARYRPDLDEISRRALTPPENPPRPNAEYDPPGIPDDDDAHRDSGDALWAALCQAPDEGTHIRDLMRITGWKHTKLYRHLREHAQAGRAIQVSRGRWRARTTGERSP